MRDATFVTGSTVPANMIIGLSALQADARAAMITPVDKSHNGLGDNRRLPYTSKTILYFKAGETIGISDAPVERALANALGLSAEEQDARRQLAREEAASKARAESLEMAKSIVVNNQDVARRARTSLAKLKAAKRPPSAAKLKAAERAVEVADDHVKAAEDVLQAMMAPPADEPVAE